MSQPFFWFTGQHGSCLIASSSYRDLLGTADRIIQLDHRMQETEELMGEVSLQCNSDVIDKKARHLAQLQGQAAQQSPFLADLSSIKRQG